MTRDKETMGQNFFDQYSLLHFAQGIVAYFLSVKPFTWFITHASFEFLENSSPGMEIINKYLTFWPGGKPRADSAINILGDNISAAAGYFFARWVDLLISQRNYAANKKD